MNPLAFRWMLLRRLRTTRCLSRHMLGFLASPKFPARSRAVRDFFGTRVALRDETTFELTVPPEGRFLLPHPLGLSEPEALWEALITLWFPVYCLDQYDAHRFLRPGDVVIDGGGHVGCFARLAAKLVGPSGRVLTVEPCPQNLPLLRENAAAGRGAPIEVLEQALASQPGELTLEWANTNLGYQALTTRLGAQVLGQLTVPATTLDALATGFERVDLIKLDVEGAEAAALAGASETLRTYRPVVIAASYHRPGDETALVDQLRGLTERYYVAPHTAYPGAEPHVIAVPEERLPHGRARL